MENNSGFVDKYFLEKIYLSGYKSIQQTEIELKSNFNIIIGKNGAGKTNFLEFLNKVLNDDFNDIYEFEAGLCFNGAKRIKIEVENKLSDNVLDQKQFILNSELFFKLKINDLSYEYAAKEYGSLTEKLKQEKFLYYSTLVKHGIPQDFDIFYRPFAFTIDDKGRALSLLPIISDQSSFFIKSLLTSFLYKDEFYNFFKNENTDNEKIRSQLKEYLFDNLNLIKPYIQQLTPISEIRFSENFNVFELEGKEKFTITNVFFEFEVNGSWYPFANLSDGTKRLFYIISEVAFPDTFFFRTGMFGKIEENFGHIILIEEPELGIHPHQLHKLMLFLKEQTRTKQIIITTHSPEVLNILGADELDSIILSEYDKEKGTLLRHMTDKEMIDAKSYINDMFLSDYWMHSNLEPAN